jgi:hypothetical protein
MAVLSDGRLALANSRQNQLAVYDPCDGTTMRLPAFVNGTFTTLVDLVPLPEGGLASVHAGSGTPALRLWDTRTRRLLHEATIPASWGVGSAVRACSTGSSAVVVAVRDYRNGARIMISCYDTTTREWSTLTECAVAGDEMDDMCALPGGRLLCMPSSGGAIIFSLTEGRTLHVLDAGTHDRKMKCLALADGSFLTCTSSATVHWTDAASPEEPPHACPLPALQGYQAVDRVADGRLLWRRQLPGAAWVEAELWVSGADFEGLVQVVPDCKPGKLARSLPGGLVAFDESCVGIPEHLCLYPLSAGKVDRW